MQSLVRIPLRDLKPGNWYNANTWSDQVWAKLSHLSEDKNKFYYSQKCSEGHHSVKDDWYRIYQSSSFIEGYYDPVLGMSEKLPSDINTGSGFPDKWFIEVTANASDHPEILGWRRSLGNSLWKEAGVINQDGTHYLLCQGVSISLADFKLSPQYYKFLNTKVFTFDPLAIMQDAWQKTSINTFSTQLVTQSEVNTGKTPVIQAVPRKITVFNDGHEIEITLKRSLIKPVRRIIAENIINLTPNK